METPFAESLLAEPSRRIPRVSLRIDFRFMVFGLWVLTLSSLGHAIDVILFEVLGHGHILFVFFLYVVFIVFSVFFLLFSRLLQMQRQLRLLRLILLINECNLLSSKARRGF